MRVNLIASGSRGLAHDKAILHGLISHVLGKEVEIRHIPSYYPQCPQAEVNVFFEVINPSLFVYAGRNIWIPNHEWTRQTWQPYAEMVDEIWCKTREGHELFEEWVQYDPKCRMIGWTSIDKTAPERKNFHKAIVPTGRNMWRNPKPILQAYARIQVSDIETWKKLPELHVVYDPAYISLSLQGMPEEVKSKIVFHDKSMPEKEYDELLAECGLCICVSAAEGFGHAVNEAMSAGCVLMLSDIDPFHQLTKSDESVYRIKTTKVHINPTCLGNLVDSDVSDLVEKLTAYARSSFADRKQRSIASRELYDFNHKTFVEGMTEDLTKWKDIPSYSLEERLPKEEDLPSVSVITITRDRRPFIPLAKYCYMAQSYPPEKLEWVIVDDGNDQIKDLVSDLPEVKYVLCEEKMSIGAKRNLGVEKASHDILVMLDDDDVYPNNSLLTRVAHMLAEPRKECIFSTTIPCYDIHASKSFMNVPPITLPMCERVSEATLCFTRAFWEAGKFPDQQIAEGDAFIKGRETACREISPQDVIVSLVHRFNTSARKAPAGESNGCHYGFSDDLFTLVTEIGESLPEKKEESDSVV